MKVVELTGFGEPEKMVISTRPVPAIASHEVLVKVTAAGVNRADIMQRRGQYPPPDGVTDILGMEVSGEIVSVGNQVNDWEIGAKICGLVAGGGYAEYCAVPGLQCLPVPEEVDLVEAASLPEAYFTVWTNIFDRGRLQRGETLLVHGGSSGVGTAAIILASLKGARVFVTAGSDEKCAACRGLGADLAINYGRDDFVEKVKMASGGRGVDVVLDMVGAKYFQQNLECLASEGRLVMIGLMGGEISTINLAEVMSRRLVVTGSTLRSRSVNYKARIAKDLLQNIWPYLSRGQIQPVVQEVFSFDKVVSAHRVMEASTHIGKLLLVP